MIYYTKSEIAEMIEQRQNMILVPETFNHAIRLELKWAYVALLNLMLDQPHYNDNQETYLIEDRSVMMQKMGTLMNKKVDEEKLNKYINELVDEELLEIIEKQYYLKK